MKHYDDLLSRLRNATKLPMIQALCNEAADAIEELMGAENAKTAKSAPTSDYISREAAIEIAMQYCPDDDGSCSKALADLRDMLDEIESIPAADVRPVVRGKWMPSYDSTEYDFDGSTLLSEPHIFQDGWQCSLCGQYEPSEENYCPNCGADMREES